MTGGFVHLHTHTAYSLLDGQGTISKILDRAKELGQTAMAITDHGNMYGAVEFYEYAKKIGIKPIIGCEVYVAARSRLDKTYELDAERYHLILLAENNIGYKNLMKIVSYGFIDGFYYKPRIDFELLEKYNEGIIALSGCMFGVLSRRILAGDYDGALKTAEKFIGIFGRDRFYVELQDHGLYDQKRLNMSLIELARSLSLNTVCTNDIHYVTKNDAEYQDVLMCIQTGKTVDDESRMKMESSELYVKSESEMRGLFPYSPESVDNTVKIAERCNVEFEFGKLHLPEFDVPGGLDAFEYLKRLAYDGLKMRYPNCTADVHDRLEYELDTIRSMGYVDYFLIVRDFIRYAKDNGIPVGPGRGSAAGSVVSYCLEITNVDPIRYDLIFERFLNPERVSMPDIDVDFCYERRGEVIDYVNRKYGSDRVCQIITFGTMAAKQVVRDVGRALNVPYSTADALAKQIPNELHMTLEKALAINPKLKSMYDGDEQIKKLIDIAKELEGLPRHASTHAAGVVITGEPVVNYVPLQKNDDVITTQFPMTTIERLGLLKMDFLGLRTLTVIKDAANMAAENHGAVIDTDKIPLDDEGVYNMISSGRTGGVFQLESVGMTRFMTELKPSSLEDIIAGISLYRPGPMDSIPRYIANKNDPSRITYKHPLLEPILNVTYGCIVYQEQVMQIVRELGGYSLGRADLVRRAMSKKKADVMAHERSAFIDGAKANGIDEDTAASIFDEMMDFASYAFNKSHAAAYAVVAYQTAWLKLHYPPEFYAAMLNSFIDSAGKVTKYILIAEREGITVVPPDINISESRFRVSGGKIIFGLGAVKSVGEGVVEAIDVIRRRDGRFASFTDFCQRTSGVANKKAVENLIKCGAFDSLGLKRSVLLIEYEVLMDSISASLKRGMPGQISLFDMDGEVKPAADNFSDRDELAADKLLAMEKESIGMYLTAHPLDEYRDLQFNPRITQIINVIENEGERYTTDTPADMIGIVNSVRTRRTKRGDIMKYFELEDLTGTIECLAFPSQTKQYTGIIEQDKRLYVRGELDISDDYPPKLKVRTIETLGQAFTDRLYIYLETRSDKALKTIQEILSGASGNIDVCLCFEDTGRMSRAKAKISLDDNRIERLKQALGDKRVRLVKCRRM